jgi:small subunit ribosomal protein S19e
VGIFEVPATELIKLIASDFENRIQKPEFTQWVKTGANRERAPYNQNWWFVRTASILYRIFADGPVGTERLRTYYGGKKNRGVKPEKFRKASGKIIRTCLQALEKEGLVKKAKKGRIITPKGQKYLNQKSKEIAVKKTQTPEHIPLQKQQAPNKTEESKTPAQLKTKEQPQKIHAKLEQKKEEKNE